MPDKTPSDDSDAVREGPEFEVWNHLEAGWQEAHDDMARKLAPESMRFFEALAEAIVGLRTDLVVPDKDLPVPESLARTFPQLATEHLQQLVRRFFQEPSLIDSSSWLRHAVDLEVASLSLQRAVNALERFKSL